MTLRYLALLLAFLPGPVSAGALTDVLMAPRLFDAAPVGSVVAYAEDRSVPEAEGMTVLDVTAGEVRLEVVAAGDGREMRLVREAGGVATPVGTFPVAVANPLLLYFLETTVRVMAEATGGSPFYIRNRIREALAASDLGAAEAAGERQVTLTPFAADPNRARMGGFGELTLRLRFDPAAPARIIELSADTAGGGDGYHEKLVLIPED